MGLLDGIGQLLNPFGQDGQLDIGKIMNPGQAVLSMLMGEAKKTESNPQQTMQTASMIRNFFDQNQVEQAGAAQSKSTDTADAGGVTEMTDDPSKNVDGYTNPNSPSKLSDGDAMQMDAPISESAAATGGEAPVSAQSAATAGVSAPADADVAEVDALNTILADFPYLDGGPIGDGRFDRASLQIVANDEGHQYPKELVEAAKYVLEHPRLLASLVNFSATGNSCITGAGICAYLADKVQGGAVNQVTGGTQTPKLPPTGGAGEPSKTPPPGSHVDYNAVLGNAKDVLNQNLRDPNKSLEDRLVDGGTGYMRSLDDQIEALVSRGDLDQADMTKIQQLMQKRTEMYQLVSNIMNMFHEMAMTPINHLR